MKADLHIHTEYSGDSDLTIADLMATAQRVGLAAIAITDHDMLDGLAPARQAAAEAGLCLVPGAEVSCTFCDRFAHLLVYSDTIESGPLPAFLDEEVFEGKRAACIPMIDFLAGEGLPVSLELYDEEVRLRGKGGSPLERLLEHQGVVDGPADYVHRIVPTIPEEIVRIDWAPSLQRGIDAAHEAGALAVMAHPRAGLVYGKITREDFDEIREMGIDGIEIDHPIHAPEERSVLRDWVEGTGLFVTAGSDCHGSRERPLGDCFVEVPDRALPPVIHLRDLLTTQN